MTATLAPVTPIHPLATPEPCQIIAGLSVQYGVPPAWIRPWASRLASECPSWAAGNEAGIVAAYFDLRPGAS